MAHVVEDFNDTVVIAEPSVALGLRNALPLAFVLWIGIVSVAAWLLAA